MSSRSRATVAGSHYCSFPASRDRLLKGLGLLSATLAAGAASGRPRFPPARRITRLCVRFLAEHPIRTPAIEDVGQADVDDVPVVAEARLLHDPTGGGVVRQRDGDDLLQAQRVEGHLDRRAGQLARQAPTPAFWDDRPGRL